MIFKRPILLPLLLLILATILADMFMPIVFLRNHYIKHLPQTDTFKYLIIDSPKQTPKTFSYTAKIIAYYDFTNNQWHKTTGKIKIYIPKYNKNGSKNKLLNYGDVIVSSDKLQSIRNFDLLSSFNYVRYMRHKRIYHQVFIYNFDIVDFNKGNKIISIAKHINNYLHKRIQQSFMDKNQKELATALLLGDKKGLDKNIREQFNTSGLAHILCVSGLHIMLIIGAFSFLLKRILPHNINGIIIRNIISIVLCWIMAFIVGLTPSALRVATMLSFLIIAKFTSLNNDKVNILLVTAFIFLCLDPLILFNISFQLSFLAVLGLITIKPYLYKVTIKSLRIKRNGFKKLFANIITTISAQIFTFPIILINFHRFPIFFIITNLIVIPIMQIILFSLILMLVFADMPYINIAISRICNMELSFLITVAQITDKITTSVF